MPRAVSEKQMPQSAVAGARRPVLIVRVDAAGIEPEDLADTTGAARRCDVRLVRSVRNPPTEPEWDVDGEVTAVVILRDATPSRVVSCVRAATRGGGSISPELLGQLLPMGEEERPDASEPHLSDREYDVLRMLADGESTRGIAEQLSYSERTVKNIVHDLLVKLNCKTRAHAVALAARQGVI
jgi:DNA-binding CsgD family transcriptional regulator